MIPRLQKVIDFNNQNARKEKERLIKFFGTDNISIFTSKYVIDKPLGMSYWEMFLGFDKRIRGYESKAFYYTLDLTYKRHYNFNKYVYEIFHKKFFGTNEHERYSSKN